MAASVAVAAPAAAEEPTCALCLDGDSAENPLLQVRVCSCKGSMRYHRACVFNMAQHNPSCGACKKTLLHPDYAAVRYDAEDPELVGASYYVQQYGTNVYGKLHTFYNVDEAGKRHGLCKVFYQEHTTGFRPENPITLYEVKHYSHGVLHGTCKRWSAFQARGGIQYPEAEVTYDQGVLKGPFKLYNAYDEGNLAKTGTLHYTANAEMEGIVCFGLEALYVGEYKEVYTGKSLTYDGAHCVFKTPSMSPRLLASDDAGFAELASKLADGQHIIPYKPALDHYGKPGNADGFITLNVVDGQLEGEWVARLYSGEMVETRVYAAGAMTGPYKKMYFEALGYGKYKVLGLAEEGTYSAGRRNGAFTFNNRVGKHILPSLKANYRGDSPVGQQTLYDNKGQLLETTTLTDDGTRYLHGPAVFYEGGKVVQRCNFRLDELHGRLTLYKKVDGLPWLQVTMDRGMLKGGSWITYYDESGVIDATKSRRVAAGGDFLASVEELDETSVRCLAYTRHGTVFPQYVELVEAAAPEPAAAPAPAAESWSDDDEDERIAVARQRIMETSSSRYR
jgi:antitoxin component YwqK of YwqJK toxin-antitoxin module